MTESEKYLLNEEETSLLSVALMGYVEECDRSAGEAIDALWRKVKEVTVPATVYRAYAETRHFTFEGFGETQDEAIEVCYQGWLLHCKNYRSDVEIDPSYLSKDDIGVYACQLGEGYRDHELVEKD